MTASSLSFVSPQIPTRVAEAPDGDAWIQEIKHDGFRTLLVKEGIEVRAFTRNGHDWSNRYAPITRACKSLACGSAMIDGEIVVQDDNGVSDFDALPWAIRHEAHRLVFFAFDLLFLEGKDLRGQELIGRRQKLSILLERSPFSPLLYSEHFAGDGKAFFSAAVKHGLEGIVSKRATSRYRSGPSKHWLKIKNFVESEFVLLGLERDTEGRPFAHVGREGSEGYKYSGMAFMTFNVKLHDELARKADALTSPNCAVRGVKRPNAAWLRPNLRVRVRHLKCSNGLRHASVRSLAG